MKKSLIILTIVLAICGFAYMANAQYSGGLAAHYNFDEGSEATLQTSVGTFDGTINGATWGSGKYDSGLMFDGIDDYIDLDDLTVSGKNLTLSAFVMFDGVISSNPKILSKSKYRNKDGWSLAFKADSTTTGGFQFGLNTDEDNFNIIKQATFEPILNQWYHVAGTYNGSEMKLYVDGDMVASSPKNGYIVSDEKDVWIGGDPSGATDEPWKGRIDEVSIHDKELTEPEIRSIFETGSEIPPLYAEKPIWALINDLGKGYPVEFDGSSWSVHTEIGKSYWNSLYQDSNGNIWVGGKNQVRKYDGKDWTQYAISGNWITAITEDKEGNMWFAITNYDEARTGSILKYDGTVWKKFSTINGDLVGAVSSIITDRDGNIWAGTTNGAYKFDGTEWSIYNRNNSNIASDYIASVYEDDEGNMWFGSYAFYNSSSGDGVSKLDKSGNWTVYRTGNSGILNSHNGSIYQDSKGNMWFGSAVFSTGANGVGASKLDKSGNWTTYNANTYPIWSYIVKMSEDHLGNMWFASSSGAVKFDGDEWTTYKGTDMHANMNRGAANAIIQEKVPLPVEN